MNRKLNSKYLFIQVLFSILYYFKFKTMQKSWSDQSRK